MRFFAKLMFICNCCFLVAALFHYTKMYQTDADYPQALNFLKGTIVIIAEFGWLFNFVFVLLAGILWLRKRLTVAKWLVLFNTAVLAFQIYYYFFD